MEVWSAEKERPSRAQSSAPCWRISFFITRSIDGCNGSIRTFRSSAMPMTLSATVEVRRRRRDCARRWHRGLRTVGFDCIRKRPRSFIAKIQIAPGTYPERSFDFLGYRFRPRSSRNHDGRHFVSFLPAVSKLAAKRMRQRVRRWRLHQRNDLKLEDIATWVRPALSGWVLTMVAFIPRNFAANCARLTNLSYGGPLANTKDSTAA